MIPKSANIELYKHSQHTPQCTATHVNKTGPFFLRFDFKHDSHWHEGRRNLKQGSVEQRCQTGSTQRRRQCDREREGHLHTKHGWNQCYLPVTTPLISGNIHHCSLAFPLKTSSLSSIIHPTFFLILLFLPGPLKLLPSLFY